MGFGSFTSYICSNYQADIQTIADDAKVMKGSTNWHLGYGADLQVGYQLTSCLKLGIYLV